MTERYHGKILTRNEMIAGENYVVFGLLDVYKRQVQDSTHMAAVRITVVNITGRKIFLLSSFIKLDISFIPFSCFLQYS